jgi:hypothetical protein
MTFDIKEDIRVSYQLDDETVVYIDCDVYEVDIDRGIDIEEGVFARPSVGSATVSLMKDSLSDLVSGPAYRSDMPFQIEYNDGSWTSLFYGYIQNISMGYVATTGKLQVTITAYDQTRVALNTRLPSFTITQSGTLSSFRTVMQDLEDAVRAVDSRTAWSQLGSGGSATAARAFFEAEVISGDVLNTILDAELGWFWADPNQVCYWRTRNDINTAQGTTWSSSNPTISNVHTSSVNHYCMDSIDYSYDSDNIANVVKVLETGSLSTATSTNSTSVTNYGRQSQDFEVNFWNTSGLTTLGQWASAVSGAANPRSVKSVTVPAVRRDGTLSTILSKDICYPMQVEFSAGGTTLQEIYLISRIGHTISADHWEVNLGLWRGI